jgi:hypothetical protein
MHMDIAVYKTFTIYAIAQLFLQLVLSFLLNKLYFEEKNTLANKFSISFNILNFIILIGSSLIFKEQLHIVMTTLLIMF